MDRKWQAIEKLIPLLDDSTFDIFAGLFNARQLSGYHVSAAEEAGILREVLMSEYRLTNNQQILYLSKLLKHYLS